MYGLREGEGEMNDIRILVQQLISATYDSGYYSGKGEDGQPHHVDAIQERESKRKALIAIIERWERIREAQGVTEEYKCARCGIATSSYAHAVTVDRQIVGPLCPSCYRKYLGVL